MIGTIDVVRLQDAAWLSLVNKFRRANKLPPLSVDRFELALDRFEKESFVSSLEPRRASTKASAGRGGQHSPCAICAEADARPNDLMLSCDACSLTVHQVSAAALFLSSRLRGCRFLSGKSANAVELQKVTR